MIFCTMRTSENQWDPSVTLVPHDRATHPGALAVTIVDRQNAEGTGRGGQRNKPPCRFTGAPFNLVRCSGMEGRPLNSVIRPLRPTVQAWSVAAPDRNTSPTRRLLGHSWYSKFLPGLPHYGEGALAGPPQGAGRLLHAGQRKSVFRIEPSGGRVRRTVPSALVWRAERPDGRSSSHACLGRCFSMAPQSSSL